MLSSKLSRASSILPTDASACCAQSCASVVAWNCAEITALSSPTTSVAVYGVSAVSLCGTTASSALYIPVMNLSSVPPSVVAHTSYFHVPAPSTGKPSSSTFSPSELTPADQRHYAVYLYMQKHNATMAKACQAVYNCSPDSAAAAKDAMQHKRWEK